MRATVFGLLLAAMLAIGVAVPAAAADTAPGNCEGEIVSFAVRLFDGRRNVATTFFGDYPAAVQDAESFVRTYCGL